MLSPNYKYGLVLVVTGILAAAQTAAAGLYGFNTANPYTPEEKVLDMQYLPKRIRDYRADMRANLQMLIDYAKENNPNFKIITHEGQELLYRSAWEDASDGYNLFRIQHSYVDDPRFLKHEFDSSRDPIPNSPSYKYLHSIDAVALNNFFCGDGYEKKVTFNNNLGLISIDYCKDDEAMDKAIVKSFIDKKIIYAFKDKDKAFNNISNQPMINDSSKNISEIKDAKNILILIDDSNYTSKDRFVQDIANTNYDIIIIRPTFNHSVLFTPYDIRSMQFKKNGARRLLIAEMNMAETSPYDYFWKRDWNIGNPIWIARKSMVDNNAVITEFWNEEWKKIISKHFKDIVSSGFDGVFFTGLHNYFYFEQQTPLE